MREKQRMIEESRKVMMEWRMPSDPNVSTWEYRCHLSPLTHELTGGIHCVCVWLYLSFLWHDCWWQSPFLSPSHASFQTKHMDISLSIFVHFPFKCFSIWSFPLFPLSFSPHHIPKLTYRVSLSRVNHNWAVWMLHTAVAAHAMKERKERRGWAKESWREGKRRGNEKRRWSEEGRVGEEVGKMWKNGRKKDNIMCNVKIQTF